jgi:hypothetical protein
MCLDHIRDFDAISLSIDMSLEDGSLYIDIRDGHKSMYRLMDLSIYGSIYRSI